MMLRTFSCGWFVMVEDFFGGGRSGLVGLKGVFLAEFNRSVAALVIDVLEFELLVSREWIIWLVRVWDMDVYMTVRKGIVTDDLERGRYLDGWRVEG